MNILLISQCRKNALTETRRILDQFAERRGERTWQTAITRQGLDTLYRMLRRTARKNTAVACHWIHGKDHSELLWIVGDARQFNVMGATPTNMTRRDLLRTGDENDWHALEDIRLLATLAALFHDVGKASRAFQKKLLSAKPIADAYRHEWVSLRLFEAFVGSDCPDDRDWLERLARLENGSSAAIALQRLIRDGFDKSRSPFQTLKHPIARAVGWLIVSHHRLPTPTADWTSTADRLAQMVACVTHDWCGSREADAKSRQACWEFPKGWSLASRHWQEHARRVAETLLPRVDRLGPEAARLPGSPYRLHLARLTLMLADHYYSSQPSHARYGDQPKGKTSPLYANTERDRATGQRLPKQRLDEHLIGVAVNAGRIARALPRLDASLPRIARHKGFRQRSQGAFRWQNAAFDLAENLRERSARQGFFGVNLASTGCGKTLANGRILYGLADPRLGARFTIALGLRTLTLQTGDAYRERLHLGPEDMAVLVGGAAIRRLHEHALPEEGPPGPGDQGSESAADLMPEFNHVRFEGSLEDGPLKRWLYPERTGGGRSRDAAALLDAPVLVCTIDHLTPATESTRGGHQILPMLRLMTSDLVLDEPDDFDIADLHALTRLVHWAGLLGSRVLLSSASMPPSLVQGLYLAYRVGRAEFQRHRGEPGRPLAPCCAWFDEFGADSAQFDAEDAGAGFLAAHEAFVERRIRRLAQEATPRRRAEIVPVVIAGSACNDPARRQTGIAGQLAALMREQALSLHGRHHGRDPRSGRRVSFGLIRMANIDPLFDVALALFALGAPAGVHIHLCVYHARHPLLVRSAIERELDAVLKRHDDPARDAARLDHPGLRAVLDRGDAGDHLFIVLGTAVTEVGRDHDYDWAIVEPSSMRSIIQLAGRVRRHRSMPCPEDAPNIVLLDHNFRHFRQGGAGPVFLKPGFESAEAGFVLRTHDLAELLTPEQWRVIDARPRLRPREKLDPTGNLADLEHARLAALMLGAQPGQAQAERPVRQWWETAAHLSGFLQRTTPFRDDPHGHRTFALLPDADGDTVGFFELPEESRLPPLPQPTLLHHLDDSDLFRHPGMTSWAVPDYREALADLAEAFELEPAECARRYGYIELPDGREAQVWRYHTALGFSRCPK